MVQHAIQSLRILSLRQTIIASAGRYGGGSHRGDSKREDALLVLESPSQPVVLFYCKLLFSGVADRLILRRH